MPNKEKFALIFTVIQEGEHNDYQRKVDASNEAEAILKAPAELAAARQSLGKIPHNPRLVKVLLDADDLRS